VKLIVGLGNPGSKYEATRHNVGFRFVDWLGSRAVWKEAHGGLVASMNDSKDQKVWLLKPMTFMNLSGRSVRRMADYLKIPMSDVSVIFDDLDLSPLQVKARVGGGHGGHNGIRSLLEELPSGDFLRIKVGIGHPRSLVETKDSGPVSFDVSAWVLGALPESRWLEYESTAWPEVLKRLKEHQGLQF